MAVQPTARALEWMQRHYEGAQRYQIQQGRTFNLTFDEYVGLWSSHFVKKLNKQVEGNIARFQRTAYGFCLTWKSRAHRLESNTMDVTTACVTNKEQSKFKNQMQKGQIHSPETRARMSATHKRRFEDPAAREHMRNINLNKPKSAESNEKRAASARAYWAARKASKESNK